MRVFCLVTYSLTFLSPSRPNSPTFPQPVFDLPILCSGFDPPTPLPPPPPNSYSWARTFTNQFFQQAQEPHFIMPLECIYLVPLYHTSLKVVPIFSCHQIRNKPKMVNAPEGLNHVILRKVQRFLCLPKTTFCKKRSFFTKKVAKPFHQLITSSPSLMPTISTRCAFSYIAIWMRKPCDK